ncbi:MAG TPA: acetoacetate decarboxylase family protein [Myxococcota bacterium]|nr:acetoacetate decarboxylase family protein [Myxococcota bacterium]
MAQSPSYTIQGRSVTLPCVVREASSGAATYLVNAATARRLLPGPELDVVELWPGYALASIACIDYKDNDLGDYNEISVALFVRERGARSGLPLVGPITAFLRARLPTYIHRLPVNQAFTCEAGRTIWGFPKVVHEIDFTYRERRVVCTWRAQGQTVFTFSMPRGGSRSLPDTSLVTYSYIHGVPHRTAFTSGAEGVGFRMGGATLQLGTHPIADELRGLGFPRRALLSTWMEKMHGRFEAPEKL